MYKTIAAKAIEKLIDEQPGLAKRKDSITLFLVSVIWLASLVGTYAAELPVWVGAVAGGIASIAGILLVAFTKGAVTPSMVTRAEEAARKIEEEERISNPEPVPVEEPYVGKHRAEEPVKHERSGLAAGGIREHYLG